MNCTNCGNEIHNGDVVCTKCGFPVISMTSLNKIEEEKIQPEIISEVPTFNSGQVNVEVQPTQNISTNDNPVSAFEPVNEDIVEPRVLPYIDPMTLNTNKTVTMPYNDSNSMNTENKPEYDNYGEPQKAITSVNFILPIIIGIVAMAIVAFGLLYTFGYIVDNKKPNTDEDVVAYYTVEFNNFEYTIPSKYVFRKDATNKTLYIAASDDSWIVSIQNMNINYSNASSQKSTINSYFQTIGYTINKTEEKELEGVDYIVMEATKNNRNILLAVTKAGDSNKTFGISVQTNDNKLNYSILSELSSIYTEATYISSMTNKDEDAVDFNFSNAIK